MKPLFAPIHSAVSPVILTAAIVCGGLIGACGIKGPPVPPQQYRPATVTDLSYELINGRVTLHWTLPGGGKPETSPVSGCTVLRSQLALAGTDCIDCDASFKKAADVAVPAAATGKVGTQKLAFDDNLLPGFEYAYRVVCRTATGVSGDASNTVRFEVRQPTTQKP